MEGGWAVGGVEAMEVETEAGWGEVKVEGKAGAMGAEGTGRVEEERAEA
jgi:hypothetical protein